MAAENTNPSNSEASAPENGKSFTQEEVDNIVAQRLARQKSQYADYDDLKAKAAAYDKAQDAGKSEIQKLQESNQKLLDKMAGMEKASKIKDARMKVSTDTGVPAALLTGEDEESCKAQAAAILKFAKGKSYPGVKGEKHESQTGGKATSNGNATEEDFRKMAESIFGKKD